MESECDNLYHRVFPGRKPPTELTQTLFYQVVRDQHLDRTNRYGVFLTADSRVLVAYSSDNGAGLAEMLETLYSDSRWMKCVQSFEDPELVIEIATSGIQEIIEGMEP